ncbi:hypothetical protein HPP92_027152 [Vanilla planifolia]|uniref:Uncharacterized protein n=1 Tax=Vanilla planifolia TaxID=51239 RepID=A0A835P9W3_VANPL|nr:hypothetical protein HPP92_027152 [Vanilla planifolia]
MWRFNDLNSSFSLWPPDTGENQNSNSLVYLTYDNLCGCFPENANSPSPVFGAQNFPPHLNPAFIQPLNQQALDHVNVNVGLGDPNPSTKRFPVFDQSGDQPSLIYSSMESPYQILNQPLPAGNATYECASNSFVVNDYEDMHEDTEEIDALLYSDSEYAYDSDEDSTGHSPLFVEAKEFGNHAIPVKRQRLDIPELDGSLMDTANSARLQGLHGSFDDGIAAALSCVGSCDEPRDESVEGSKYNKRGRIQMTMDILRSIVPGGGKGHGCFA